MSWVLIRIASPRRGGSNEYPNNICFLWRNNETYSLSIPNYPPFLFHWTTLVQHLANRLSQTKQTKSRGQTAKLKTTTIIITHNRSSALGQLVINNWRLKPVLRARNPFISSAVVHKHCEICVEGVLTLTDVFELALRLPTSNSMLRMELCSILPAFIRL